MRRPAQPPQLLAMAVVAALHGTLLWAWLGGSRQPDAPKPDQPPLLVRLLSIVEPAPPGPANTAKPERPRSPSAPRWTLPSAPRWTPPAVPFQPGLPDAAPARQAPTDTAAPPTASSAGPTQAAPLNLSLPPAATRGAGRPGPPATATPRSIESQLARDLGDTGWREELLGDGRIRMRKGARCIELRDAHMAQIDPFNQSVSPIPKQAEDCAR